MMTWDIGTKIADNGENGWLLAENEKEEESCFASIAVSKFQYQWESDETRKRAIVEI